MGNCKDCEHWLHVDDFLLNAKSLPRNGYGLCDAIGIFDLPLAYIDNENKGYAGLKTSGDFGCVQFEAKPK